MRRLKDPDAAPYGRQWGLIGLGAAFAVYLLFRIVQMIGWAVDAIF